MPVVCDAREANPQRAQHGQQAQHEPRRVRAAVKRAELAQQPEREVAEARCAPGRVTAARSSGHNRLVGAHDSKAVTISLLAI